MPMIFKDHNPGDNPMDLIATHQRLLIAAAARTVGPILELGVGWYSTPLLHELARAQKRLLTTVDNNEHWLAQFRPLAGEYHKLLLVGWWGELPGIILDQYQAKSRIGMVFVDNGSPIEREYAIRNLLTMDVSYEAVYVMHDTEEGYAYGYERTLPMFRYKWTDKANKTWTTVASNGINVEKWAFIDLPPVEPDGPEIT